MGRGTDRRRCDARGPGARRDRHRGQPLAHPTDERPTDCGRRSVPIVRCSSSSASLFHGCYAVRGSPWHARAATLALRPDGKLPGPQPLGPWAICWCTGMTRVSTYASTGTSRASGGDTTHSFSLCDDGSQRTSDRLPTRRAPASISSGFTETPTVRESVASETVSGQRCLPRRRHLRRHALKVDRPRPTGAFRYPKATVIAQLEQEGWAPLRPPCSSGSPSPGR